MIYTLSNIDNPTKSLLRKTIRALLRSAGKNITLLKPEKEGRVLPRTTLTNTN
jgi:hypothetical protein